MSEEKEPKLFAVIDLKPMKYGEGKISYETYLSSEEYDQATEARFFEIINNLEALVNVNELDDGCIDGRWTIEVYVNDEDGEPYLVIADNSNHERAKVSGGGYLTSVAMRLGAGVRGSNVDDDIEATGLDLATHDIYCGGHTAEGHAHADDVKTGCGANDELPVILHNGIAYKNEIKKTMEELLTKVGMDFNEDLFEEVIGNWEAVMADESYFASSTGLSRLQKILNLHTKLTKLSGARKPVGVVKKLGGAHKEIDVIINFVEGKTVSQGMIANKLEESAEARGVKVNKETLPQAFVVDAWRLVQLAGGCLDEEHANELNNAKALYAGVMYQFATAATLTDGSLKMQAYALAA